MGEKLKISYTRASTFLHCRQKYHWEYIENLTPIKKSRPLKVGGLVHSLLHTKLVKPHITQFDVNFTMDAARTDYPGDDEGELASVALEATILVNGYLEKYKDDPLTVVPGETMLEADMGEYTLIGRSDAYARTEDTKLWRMEHKTMSRLDSNYLQGLKSGLQGGIYDYLTERLFNEEVSGTIYNLIVKTKIPNYHRSFTKCDRGAIQRMLQTIHGVHRDIQRGDFYPSSKCYSFASVCPFKVLCEFDSPGAREAFFTRRKEVTDDTELKDGDSTE